MTERLSFLRPHPFPAGHALADYGLSPNVCGYRAGKYRAIRRTDRTESVKNPYFCLVIALKWKRMSWSKLSKEQLEELVRTYARNMLALDGVWFQSVERELGMDRAMRHDDGVQAFTQTEARRIKGFLAVARQAGTGRTGAGAFAPLRGIRQPAGRTDTGKRFPDIPCGRLPGTVCAQAKRDAVASRVCP